MKSISIILIIIISVINTLVAQAQNNPDFFLDSNGVTCMCPDANFGDTGELTINGEQKVFTKRTRQELSNLIFNDDSDPQIALTCTSGITDMSDLFFYRIYFNQNLEHWDVSQVVNMNQMFQAAISFNQPLDNWDVSSVLDMRGMFYEATSFDQDLSMWSFNQDISLGNFIGNTAISNQNYDNLLQSFDNQNLVDLGLTAYGIGYCDASTRSNLINNKGWEIKGDLEGQCGQVLTPSTNPFVTTWNVSQNDFDLSVNIFTIKAYNYDFTIDWGDGQSDQNVTSDITHNYANPGIYTVSITGVFPYFKNCEVAVGPEYLVCQNNNKLISVNSWGDQDWRAMMGSFRGAENMTFNTTQAPEFVNVTSLNSTFQGASSFNQSINNWDVSQVTNMDRMFYNAVNFNQPLNDWDVSQVTTMDRMFFSAVNFNQSLNDWDVSQVTTMFSMFGNAVNFNQPLNDWDVSSVVQMTAMFQGFAGPMAFNQPLNNWDVSNVVVMDRMFLNAGAFNQPLDNWDVSNVNFMSFMFKDAFMFNQDISMWCVEQIYQVPTGFAEDSALQNNYFPDWGEDCDTFGINYEKNLGLEIYPNPVQDILHISLKNQPFYDQLEITVYDMNGNMISNQTHNQVSFQIDISRLSTGIYFVKITSNSISQTKRIIKL